MTQVLNALADIVTFLTEWLRGLLESINASPMLIDILLKSLGAITIVIFLLTTALFIIWVERKMVGRIQDRIGPNRVGPWGLLQNFADVAKLLTKEIILPDGADVVPFMLAPIISVASVFMVWGALPFTRTTLGTNVIIGVLYIVAVSSLGIMSVLMAGWSSNNKYALLGAFRGVAMLVSYEVPMILTLLVPVLLAGSMRVNDIVEAQGIWYVFAMPIAAAIFYIANHAEAGRSPFDLLEAESEIVAGYHTEYSGMAFAMFYLAEFLHAFTISALTATLFFGGWRGPGAAEIPTLGFIYFFAKTFAIYFVNIWARGTLPRLRIDQTMNFCWKFLVPVSLVLLVTMLLVDKTAATLLPDSYVLVGSFVEMLPRTLILLVVNLVIGGLTMLLVMQQGRRERERLAALDAAPVERVVPSQAK